MTFQTLANQAQKMIGDNSPLILTGIGAAGVITTAVLTGKATIKACEILQDEREAQLLHPEIHPFKPKYVVKRTWQLYIPPAVSGIVTVGAIIVAHKVGTRRAAAMASAYVLTEKAFSEYKDKVVEKMGETKARNIRDEVAQDRLDNQPVTESTVVLTNGGTALCLEPYSGRYFQSDMESIKKAQNDLNYQVLNNQYASLTDFYNLIGLDRTLMSDDVGWNSDKMLELSFTSGLADNGLPCLVMDYRVVPIRNYDRAY